MITLFCSPRHINYDSPFGGVEVGLPVVLDGLDTSSMGGGLVSDTSHVPSLNLCIWQANLTQEQIDAISAHPNGYVFDSFRLQQGDTSGFVQWLKDRGVTKAEFDTEFAEMAFADASLAALGGAVSGAL